MKTPETLSEMVIRLISEGMLWTSLLGGFALGMLFEANVGTVTKVKEAITPSAPKAIEFSLVTSSGSHKLTCIDDGKDSLCELSGGKEHIPPKPGPRGNTVMQNGYIYNWNPKTQKYE